MRARELVGRRHRVGSPAAGPGAEQPPAPLPPSGPARRSGFHRRRTVALLLLLGLLPLAAVGVISTALGASAIASQVSTRLADAGRHAARSLDQEISARITAMNSVANQLAVLSAAEHEPSASTAAAEAELRTLMAAAGTDGVVLTDAQGNAVEELGAQDPLEGLPAAWVSQLSHERSLAAPAAAGTGPPAMDLGVPVLKGGGGVGGFIVEHFSLSQAASNLRAQAASQGMTLLVLGPGGQLVMGAQPARAAGTATSVGTWKPTAAALTEESAALRDHAVQTGTDAGMPSATSPLDAVSWVVRASLPASALAAIPTLQISVLVACAALALVFLAGVVLVNRALRGLQRAEAGLLLQTAALEHAAMHDPLTALPNRLLFNDRLQHGISNARRSGRGMALFVLDVDGFKALNDSLGHATGDAVLRETANRLQASVRASDTVARLGGDEFAIVAVDADRADAELIQAKIRQRMDEPMTVDEGEVSVHLSIGLAVFPEDSAESAPLLRRADTDMYRDKRARKSSAR